MGQNVIFEYTDVSELKTTVSKIFTQAIHFHDGCGGQYFSFDKHNEELKNFIIKYFSDRNMKAVFSADSLNFTVEKGNIC